MINENGIDGSLSLGIDPKFVNNGNLLKQMKRKKDGAVWP